MAVNEKRLSVTEFDFDDVKDNLKVRYPCIQYSLSWFQCEYVSKRNVS